MIEINPEAMDHCRSSGVDDFFSRSPLEGDVLFWSKFVECLIFFEGINVDDIDGDKVFRRFSKLNCN